MNTDEHGLGSEAAQLVAANDRLNQQVSDLEREVEQAKAARNRAGVEEGRKYLPKIAELAEDRKQFDWLCGHLSSDFMFDEATVTDYADMEQWEKEGGNDDCPEIRKAWRKAIAAAMKKTENPTSNPPPATSNVEGEHSSSSSSSLPSSPAGC